MASGTELGKAYVQIVPSADGIKGKLTNVLSGEASSAGDIAGKTAGYNLASAIKNAVIAAGIGAALKNAIFEGADLQQSLGGIETLFKESSAEVIASAKNAYKTAGISANEYMETVTSFSASLLQGLAGDTAKAADVADMALTDMSDNANKMGTSMELIQNAYQGFAKQNYTMLDNLKLGYGGTKTEMQRLLADAQKLSGVEYNLDNLSDVYEAIHVIQEEMGITGTTEKEAASTFSGSLASMKAAFSNLLGNLSLGEDIRPSLTALKETVSTFLAGNLLPMVGNMFSNLPLMISEALNMAVEGLDFITENADMLMENGIALMGSLVEGIISALPSLAGTAVGMVEAFGTAIMNTDWLVLASDMLMALKDSISIIATDVIGVDANVVEGLFGGISTAYGVLWDKCNTIWTTIGQPIWDAFTTAIQNVSIDWENVSGVLSEAFQSLWDICGTVWAEIGQPIWDAIMSTVQFLGENWTSISETISSTFQMLWDVCQTVWETIGQPVWDIISFTVGSLAELFAKHMPAIMGFFQSAVAGIQDTWNNHLKPIFDAIGKVLNEAVKPAFEFVWKTIVEPLITNVFGVIADLWNNTLKPVFDGICDFLLGAFTNNWDTALKGILGIVIGIFNGIRTAVEVPMNLIKDIVNKAIDFITEKFDFEWSLPDLKMPHFSISGSFSINPPSVPSFDVEWYKEGGVMMNPTLFGLNPFSGKAMVGGEAGAEAIAPIETLQRYIREAVTANDTVVVKAIEENFAKLLMLLTQYFSQMERMKVVLDTGAMVGEMAPELDDALGWIAILKEKGVL